MILEIDTSYLIKNKITAHQYTIAKLVRDDRVSELKKYLKLTRTDLALREDLENLHEAGFISESPGSVISLDDIKITTNFSQSHTFTNDPFEEMYDAFPTKVLRPDGSYDYLRVDQKRCRKIYYNIIRESPTLHKFIIRCLNAEVADRKLRGQMPFMKRMPTWLTSEGWKAYADVAEHSDDSTLEGKEVRYGESFE
jgi:hypothetical protein